MDSCLAPTGDEKGAGQFDPPPPVTERVHSSLQKVKVLIFAQMKCDISHSLAVMVKAQERTKVSTARKKTICLGSGQLLSSKTDVKCEIQSESFLTWNFLLASL